MKKIVLLVSCMLLVVSAWAQRGSPWMERVHVHITIPASGSTYNVSVYSQQSGGGKTLQLSMSNIKPVGTPYEIDTNFYFQTPQIINMWGDASRTGCGNQEFNYQIPGNVGTGMSFYVGCAPVSAEVHFDMYVSGVALIKDAVRTNPADNVYAADQNLYMTTSYCGWQSCPYPYQYSLDGQTYQDIPFSSSFASFFSAPGATLQQIFPNDWQNMLNKTIFFRGTFSQNYYRDNSHSTQDSSHTPTSASEGTNALAMIFYPSTPKPVAVTGVPPLCYNSSSNSVTVKFNRAILSGEVVNPVSVYKFSSPVDSVIWDQVNANITSLDASNSITVNGIRDMPPGDYGLVIEGKHNGTPEINKTFYHFTITAPAEVTFTTTGHDALCFGGANGYIDVTPAGGTGNNYQFSKDNGATWQAGSQFTGLAKGTYNVTVKDGNGCVARAAQAVVVNEPPTGLTATIATAIDPRGYHTYDGSTSVSVSGGTTPYAYAWNNGGTTAAIAGLGGGTYTVAITDANGCPASQSVTLIEPDPLTVNLVATPVSCNAAADATLQANPAGGVTPYSYSWSNGKSTRKITALTPGTYTVTVTDANNITTTGAYTVSEPDVLQLQLTAANVTCNAAANGSINSLVSGGTTPYTYAWSNGANSASLSDLTPGNFELDVTDAHGCAVAQSATITEPPALTTTGVTATPTRFGAADGGVTLTVGGGTAPYTYAWSNGAASKDLSNAGDGAYNVTVTDANGCMLVRTFVLHQPAPLVLDLQQQAAVLCHDSAQGRVYGHALGGVRPYQYSWSNGATDSVNTRLAAGIYTLTVTDKSGVTATQNITVSQPAALQVSYVTQQVGCNGDASGAAAATVSGGTAPYQYAWQTGATTAHVSNLEAGEYQLSVTDANACPLQSSVNVIGPDALSLTGAERQPTCYGSGDASLVLSPSGGRQPYTYQWSNGSNTKDISQLTAGTYSVKMKDSAGCLISHTFTLADPQPLKVSLGPDRTLCKGQVLTLDGTVPQGASYTWSSDEGYSAYTAVVGLSEPGTYNVTSTDVKGCIARDTILVRTTDQVISADFLVSTQAFTGDTLIIANISYPALDKVEWELPEAAQVISQDASMAEVKFTQTGTYQLSMMGYLGSCIASETRDVVILQSTALPAAPASDFTSLFSNVVLRPNPNNGQFSVDFTVLQDIFLNFRVVDFMHNQTLYQRKSQALANVKTTESFNITGLTTGIYLLVIEAPGEVKSLKLLIL